MMDKILKMLFEEGKKNYRTIVDSGIHPNVARRRLDELIKKGLVREEGREDWKRGKPLFYSLTKKGKQATFNILLDDLNEVLKTTERMLSKFLSEPKRIGKWRKAARESFFEMKISEDMSLDKRISHVVEEMKKIYGPLIENLWLMHQIIIKAMMPKPFKDVEVYVGAFQKNGNVILNIVPKQFVEEWKEACQ